MITLIMEQFQSGSEAVLERDIMSLPNIYGTSQDSSGVMII